MRNCHQTLKPRTTFSNSYFLHQHKIASTSTKLQTNAICLERKRERGRNTTCKVRSQGEVQSIGASSGESTSMPTRNRIQLAQLQWPDPEPRRPRAADEAQQQQQQRTKTGETASTFGNYQNPKTRGEANRESGWGVSPTIEKEMAHGWQMAMAMAWCIVKSRFGVWLGILLCSPTPETPPKTANPLRVASGIRTS